jgi:hypothetical protein
MELIRVHGKLTPLGRNSATQEAIRRFHAAKYSLAYPTRRRRLYCAVKRIVRKVVIYMGDL